MLPAFKERENRQSCQTYLTKMERIDQKDTRKFEHGEKQVGLQTKSL